MSEHPLVCGEHSWSQTDSLIHHPDPRYYASCPYCRIDKLEQEQDRAKTAWRAEFRVYEDLIAELGAERDQWLALVRRISEAGGVHFACGSDLIEDGEHCRCDCEHKELNEAIHAALEEKDE